MSIHIVILTQVGVPILDLGVNVTKDTAQKYHLLPIKIFYILSLTNRDVGLRNLSDMVQNERIAFNSKEHEVLLFYRKTQRLSSSANANRHSSKGLLRWSLFSLTKTLISNVDTKHTKT